MVRSDMWMFWGYEGQGIMRE